MRPFIDRMCASTMPPIFRRHAIGAEPIQECLCIRADNVVLGEAAKVENADTFAYGQALIAHQLEDIAAVK